MTGELHPACEQARLDLGVYVVGALPAEEAGALWTHLYQCPACRAEYEALAGLPALLSLLTEEEAVRGPVRDTTGAVLDGLLRRVAEEREQQAASKTAAKARRAAAGPRRAPARRRWLVAAAAALALLFGGGGFWAVDRLAQPAEQTVAATDAQTRVHASVSYRAQGAGTQISLKLTGVPVGERCKLVAVDRDGTRKTTASWQVTYSGKASFTVGVPMRADAIDRFEIVTEDGRRLVSVPAAR